MKKVSTFAMAVALLLTLLVGIGAFSLSAAAVEEQTPRIGIDSGIGYTGDVCTPLYIRIFNNPGISSLKIKVTYPAAYFHGGEPVGVMSLIQVAEQDFPGLVIEPLEEGTSTKGFYLIWESPDGQDVTTDGVLAGVYLYAEAGNDSIDNVPIRMYCQTGDAVNAAGETVDFDTANGMVELWLYRVGDANCDGKTNNRDLGVMQRYLNDEGDWVSTETADLNGDGKINNRDLGLLQKYLNGDDVTLHNPFEDYDGTIQNR